MMSPLNRQSTCGLCKGVRKANRYQVHCCVKKHQSWLNKKLGGSSDFKVSTGWLKNSKLRHGIRELHIEGESLSSDSVSASQMKQKFLDIVESEGYTRDDVYSTNETGLNWKSLPKNSLASRREFVAPGFKVMKERVMVMVCVNASGTHRLPLLVIGKSTKP